jgi:uncharacterized phage protein gp47/JayE
MPLNAPTIQEIADNIIGDIEAKVGQTVPLLAKAVFRVMGNAFGGVWLLLYKQGVWLYNQTFPQLASEKFLELLGENKRVIRTPGVGWEGTITVTVLEDNTLFAGQQLINNTTGVIYVVTATTAVTTPTHDVQIKSTTLGEISALQVGQNIDFVSPLGFVESEVEVASTTVDAADQEDLEDYRARVIDAYQKQPQGGALADYEQWAEETPDVINAYPYPGTLPSEVTVYIEVDDQPAGIPTAPQLAAALQYITYDPITGRQDRKPVTADVTTAAITRTAFDVDITGLSPDTSEVRSAVQTALENYFTGREPYILGLSIERVDKITESAVTAAAENAANALGSTFTTLVLEQGGAPITSYTLGDGEKAKLGTLTWL